MRAFYETHRSWRLLRVQVQRLIRPKRARKARGEPAALSADLIALESVGGFAKGERLRGYPVKFLFPHEKPARNAGIDTERFWQKQKQLFDNNDQ